MSTVPKYRGDTSVGIAAAVGQQEKLTKRMHGASKGGSHEMSSGFSDLSSLGGEEEYSTAGATTESKSTMTSVIVGTRRRVHSVPALAVGPCDGVGGSAPVCASATTAAGPLCFYDGTCPSLGGCDDATIRNYSNRTNMISYSSSSSPDCCALQSCVGGAVPRSSSSGSNDNYIETRRPQGDFAHIRQCSHYSGMEDVTSPMARLTITVPLEDMLFLTPSSALKAARWTSTPTKDNDTVDEGSGCGEDDTEDNDDDLYGAHNSSTTTTIAEGEVTDVEDSTTRDKEARDAQRPSLSPEALALMPVMAPTNGSGASQDTFFTTSKGEEGDGALRQLPRQHSDAYNMSLASNSRLARFSSFPLAATGLLPHVATPPPQLAETLVEVDLSHHYYQEQGQEKAAAEKEHTKKVSSCVSRELQPVRRERPYWALQPRLYGVNTSTLYRPSTFSSHAVKELNLNDYNPTLGGEQGTEMEMLITTAIKAFGGVLGRPIELSLHENSAGGTYMVRDDDGGDDSDNGDDSDVDDLANHATTEQGRSAFSRSIATDSSMQSIYSQRTSQQQQQYQQLHRAKQKGPIRAVFKPRDEEIGQDYNPHNNRESDRTDAFAPGSGSRREVLAYGLDHGHFAGVPPTLEVVTHLHIPQSTMITTAAAAAAPALSLPSINDNTSTRKNRPHAALEVGENPSEGALDGEEALGRATAAPRIGSLQLFLPNCLEAADVLPGKFNVEEVHALAIFDIRTLNGDRHGGNVLVSYQVGTCTSHDKGSDDDIASSSSSPKEDVPHLVPIDHSYICPAGFADPDYEWLSWPQSSRPFSQRSLAYIRNLDAHADAALVRASLLSGEHVVSGAVTLPGPPSTGMLSDTYGDVATSVGDMYADDDLAAFLVGSPITTVKSYGAWKTTTGTTAPDADIATTVVSAFEDLVYASPVVVSEKHKNQSCQKVATHRTGPCEGKFGSSEMDGVEGDDEIAALRSFKPPTMAHMDGVFMHEGGGETDVTGAFPTYGDASAQAPTSTAAASYDVETADAAEVVMLCTTRLLQIAALEFQLNAYEIGSLCRRPRLMQPAFLEEAMENARDEVTWEFCLDTFERLVRDKLTRRRDGVDSADDDDAECGFCFRA